MSKLKKPTENPRVTKKKGENSNEASGGGVMPAAPAAADGEWRSRILPGRRQRVVDKIMRNLMRDLPFSGVKDLQKFNEIAVKIEERSFAAGLNLTDYLTKTALKVYLLVETMYQNPVKFLLPTSNSRNPLQLVAGEAETAADGIGKEVGDWRTQLQPNTRHNIVNTITEVLKNTPQFGPEGMREPKELAVKFEEEIYAAAMSKLDYIRKILTKMTETRALRHFMISLRPSSENIIQNFQDPAWARLWKSIWIVIPYQTICGDTVNAMNVDNDNRRIHCHPDFRKRMQNIVEGFKEHPAFSGPERNNELAKIAETFAEKIFAAEMQPHFVSDIATEIFAMEIKTQNPEANSLQSEAELSNQCSQDPAYLITLKEINAWAIKEYYCRMARPVDLYP